MASYYINTDTGNDTTGTGTSASPWASMTKAYASSLVGDIIFCDGSAPDSTATIDLSGRFILQNPASPRRTYTLQLEFISGYKTKFSNGTVTSINITLNAATSFQTLDFYGNTYESSLFQDVFIKNISGGQKTQILNVPNNARSRSIVFVNCDFDLNQCSSLHYATYYSSKPSTFIGCSFFNFTASTSAIVSGVNDVFHRCKFYDNTGLGSICLFTTDKGNRINFSHCTFLISSSSFSIIDNSTIGGSATFNNCIIEGEGITYTSMYSSTTNQVFGLIGNNLFHNATTNSAYIANLSDYQDTAPVFKSYVRTDPNFLVISDTSNGKNGDTLNMNLDCGAVQGTALTDYPVETDVKSGVSYSFGTLTGSLVIPAAPNDYDVRSGVTVGSVTGTLVVPAVAQVGAGVEYDAAPNLKTGTAELLAPQQGPMTITVYTSDNSNISATTTSPTVTVEYPSGTLWNTILSDLGASETYEIGTSLIRNSSNSRRLDLRIDR